MADLVLVHGLRRAGELVPIHEVRQMVGRAGRGVDQFSDAKAVVVVPTKDSETAESYLSDDIPGIVSQLTSCRNVAFHVIASICSGEVSTREEMSSWFSRSFASSQGAALDIERVVKHLEDTGCLESGEKLAATALGRVSAFFYFSPQQVWGWKVRFEELMDRGLCFDDVALAWALGGEQLGYVSDHPVVDEYLEGCSSYGLESDDSRLFSCVVHFSMIRGFRPKFAKRAITEKKGDVDRVFSALALMAEAGEWDTSRWMEYLRLRLKHGISEDQAQLMLNLGIKSRTLAKKLSEYGIITLEDLKNNLQVLRDYDDERFVKLVEKVLQRQRTARLVKALKG